MVELPLPYIFKNITDLDIMIILTDVVAVEFDQSELLTCDAERLIIDDSETEVGFVKLLSPSKGRFYSQFNSESDSVKSKGPSLKRILTEMNDNFVAELGVCLKTDITPLANFTIDQVISIKRTKWPSIAKAWLARDRINGWPSPRAIRRIAKRGCHFVSQPEMGRQWRYSFSQAELTLLRTWSPTQKYVYHVLRLILRELREKLRSASEPEFETTNSRKWDRVFCSYSLKTLMLWKCEGNSSDFWKEDCLVASIKSLVICFMKILIERQCPSYFIRTCNIWKRLESHDNFQNEINFLYLFANSESTLVRNLLTRNPLVEEQSSSWSPRWTHASHQAAYQLFGFASNLIVAGGSRSFQEYLNSLFDAVRATCKALVKQRYYLTNGGQLNNGIGLSVSELEKYFQNSSSSECRHQAERAKKPTFEFTCQLLKHFAPHVGESDMAPLFHLVISDELTPPLFYFTSAAYRANFYYMCAKDYNRAVEVCDESLIQYTELNKSFAVGMYPVLITTHLTEIYDNEIKVILRFYALVKSIRPKRDASQQTNHVTLQVNPNEFIRYIRGRCSNKPQRVSVHTGSNFSDKNVLNLWRELANFACRLNGSFKYYETREYCI